MCAIEHLSVNNNGLKYIKLHICAVFYEQRLVLRDLGKPGHNGDGVQLCAKSLRNLANFIACLDLLKDYILTSLVN